MTNTEDELFIQLREDLEKVRNEFGQLKTKPSGKLLDKLAEIHKDYKEIMTLDELVKEYTYTYMVRGR